MKPKFSYTIWFTQRTGSTLLYKALESTGIAGVPREWFNCPPALTKTADAVSEEWVQRFREERQNGWTNRGW